MPITISIDSCYIELTAGDYELVWGTLDPNQFATQRVVIAFDNSAAVGMSNILLPYTSSLPSDGVQLYVVKTSNDAFPLRVEAHPADNVNSGDWVFVNPKGAVFLQNLALNIWSAFLTV